MRIQAGCFNTYLALLMALGLLCGCQSPETKRKKQISVLRVHIEAMTPIPNQTPVATVFRAAPMQLYVEPRPFLTEENVRDAKVTEAMGSYALQIELNRSGRLLLEQYTTANRMRRLAIFTHFADPAHEKEALGLDRWIAAPRISQAVTNGMLVFTPDASRVEAEQIALGLRNAAKKYETGKEPAL